MYDRIVLVTGMPRSGTSWLGQIFDSSPEVRLRLSPLFSYEFKNQLNEQSPWEEWQRVLSGAYVSQNEFMNQTDKRAQGKYPSFPIKESAPCCLVIKDTRFHNLSRRILELSEEPRIIAIVRHPCGAIHSWLTSANEFPKDADPVREWRSGECRKTGYGEFWGFDDWKETTNLYLRLADEFPGRVYIQRYEDLVDDSLAWTEKMFAFAGLAVTEQTRAFLESCHRTHDDDQYAVFKNKSVKTRWKEELDPDIQAAIIREVEGTQLARFLA